MHIFKYSKRQGTRAAVMENQVPEEIEPKSAQCKTFGIVSENVKRIAGMLGSEQEVLFQDQVPVDGTPMYVGYTKEYVR